MWSEEYRADRQKGFDLTIGRLDRILSILVELGRVSKRRNEKKEIEKRSDIDEEYDFDEELMDKENQQTLKHHAEDMIAAGQKILKDLGKDVEGTPQPEKI